MALPDAFDLPQPFGDYTLLHRIAVGGMAEIYRAKTRTVADEERLVAIKVIHPRLVEDHQFVQMMVEEARISVLLSHPNIAHCFDLGCIDGIYFLVMEYIDGADAFRVLRKASEVSCELPVDVCLYVAAEVAAGLEHAHTKTDVVGRPLSIVHRDVSPQNILLGLGGEVKLIDFGIAKAAMRAGQTQAGVIKGKFHYMSPEQARGEAVDGRSDLFSVGVVLYELLTGRALYDEDSVPELLDRVRGADIEPPAVHRAALPPPVNDLVLRALAEQRDKRFQTAGAMERSLRSLLVELSPEFSPERLAELVRSLMGRAPAEVAGGDMDHAGASSEAAPRNTVALSPLVHEDFRPDPDKSVILEAPRQPPMARRPAQQGGATRQLRNPQGDDASHSAKAPSRGRPMEVHGDWDEPTVVEDGVEERRRANPRPTSLGRGSPFHEPLSDDVEPTVRAVRPPDGALFSEAASAEGASFLNSADRMEPAPVGAISPSWDVVASDPAAISFNVDTERTFRKPTDALDQAATTPRFTATELADPVHAPAPSGRLFEAQVNSRSDSQRNFPRRSSRVFATAFFVFVVVAVLGALGSAWLLW